MKRNLDAVRNFICPNKSIKSNMQEIGHAKGKKVKQFSFTCKVVTSGSNFTENVFNNYKKQALHYNMKKVPDTDKDKMMEWKYTDCLVKKKFWSQWLIKKVMLTVFWDMKGPITIDRVKTHRLSGKEKVLVTVVNKEGDADSVLGHEGTHHYWWSENKLKVMLTVFWDMKGPTTIGGVKTHWLSGNEKVLVTVVNKEGDADSVLGHERTHHYWFLWKRCNCKQCFLLQTLQAKFTLFIGEREREREREREQYGKENQINIFCWRDSFLREGERELTVSIISNKDEIVQVKWISKKTDLWRICSYNFLIPK